MLELRSQKKLSKKSLKILAQYIGMTPLEAAFARNGEMSRVDVNQNHLDAFDVLEDLFARTIPKHPRYPHGMLSQDGSFVPLKHPI